jgi:dual specificity tyrosine-phosphorylation-regulated kinase 2/3/4
MMELLGIPPTDLLQMSQRKAKFFNEQNMPMHHSNKDGKTRKPGTKCLEDILDANEDPAFINFLEQCLQWDPAKRMTPEEGIKH